MSKKERAPSFVRSHLKQLEARCRALADPENESCSIDPKVKELVSSYLTAYVIPHLNIMSDWAKGEDTPDWWKRGAS